MYDESYLWLRLVALIGKRGMNLNETLEVPSSWLCLQQLLMATVMVVGDVKWET